MAFKDLPTFYYHTHFLEFLDFVRGPSAHLLNPDHQAFLARFDALEFEQQCTVVRLTTRKYPIIKRASLIFKELPLIDMHLPEIAQQGFACDVQNNHVEQLLEVLTKPELISIYGECASIDMPALIKSASKATLFEQCKKLEANKVAQSELAKHYIVRLTDSYLDYFLYLYFGHGHGKLNQFSMRDLGLMRTRDEQAQMQSRFADYKHAYSCFCLQNMLHKAKRQNFESAEKIRDYYNTLPEAHGNQAQEYLHSILYVLAKAMLAFDAQYAINIVANVNSAMAQEFWCRQAYKLGLKDEVKHKLNQLIDDPLSEHLLQFAEDFLARKYKQKRTSVLTDMLRENNRQLLIDETFKGSVEHGVIAYYQARGIQAWRTENYLWNNLFGLCFWHELFELDGLGLATPFDYLPTCLKHHQLMDVAGNQINACLAKINTPEDLLRHITKQAAAHFGKGQAIVSWHANIIDTLKVLIDHSKVEAIKGQLLTMCQNYSLNNDGYPDIMVVENGHLRFEEIKAQGDSLRRNQLMQIQSLKEYGFDVGITRVDFTLDPMQPYAVVDIETTGGRAGTHKITEIGIVKMVNGEIIEQWQTLLNPQRRIPSMITQLTGINDDMVASAPLFADIADDLERFTENCIFVAHNVNFDYGFIREEFARINRSFKRPKLCTVQQMRKHYKGLSSYSLANLTRHFDIGMQRHHRALSDAVAAAELLKLVNEARSQT